MAFRAATGLSVLKAKEFIGAQSPDLVDRIVKAAAARLRIPDVNKLANVPPELQDRIFLAAEKSGEVPYLIDPIEDDPEVGPDIRRILGEVEVAMRDADGRPRLGACHLIWRLAKERLAKECGIKWYSPAEMNPGSCFD